MNTTPLLPHQEKAGKVKISGKLAAASDHAKHRNIKEVGNKLNQKKRLKGESYIGYTRSAGGVAIQEIPKAARTLKPRCQHSLPKK